MKYTDKSLTFDAVQKGGMRVPSGPLQRNGAYAIEGDDIKAIRGFLYNAIDIDWNNVKVDTNTYIRTTADLLRWILGKVGGVTTTDLSQVIGRLDELLNKLDSISTGGGSGSGSGGSVYDDSAIKALIDTINSKIAELEALILDTKDKIGGGYYDGTIKDILDQLKAEIEALKARLTDHPITKELLDQILADLEAIKNGYGGSSGSGPGQPYDDTFIKGQISDLLDLISGLQTTISEIHNYTSDQIKNLAKEAISEANWLRDNFDWGALFTIDGWDEKINAYLREIGIISEDGNIVTWTEFTLKYNEIISKINNIKLVTSDGEEITYETLLAYIRQVVADNESITEIRNSWMLSDEAQNQLEWMTSSYRASASEGKTFAEVISDAQSTDVDGKISTAVAGLRTEIERNENGLLTSAVTQLMSSLDGRVSGLETSVENINGNYVTTGALTTAVNDAKSGIINSIKENEDGIVTQAMSTVVSQINDNIAGVSTRVQTLENGEYLSESAMIAELENKSGAIYTKVAGISGEVTSEMISQIVDSNGNIKSQSLAEAIAGDENAVNTLKTYFATTVDGDSIISEAKNVIASDFNQSTWAAYVDYVKDGLETSAAFIASANDNYASTTAVSNVANSLASYKTEVSNTYAKTSTISSIVADEVNNKINDSGLVTTATLEEATSQMVAKSDLTNSSSTVYADVSAISKSANAGLISGVDDKISALETKVTEEYATTEALATLDDDFTLFRGTVEKDYAKTSMIASVTDDDGNVTSASIMGIVKDNASEITINADNIYLAGLTNFLNALGDALTVKSLAANTGTIAGWTISDDSISKTVRELIELPADYIDKSAIISSVEPAISFEETNHAGAGANYNSVSIGVFDSGAGLIASNGFIGDISSSSNNIKVTPKGIQISDSSGFYNSPSTNNTSLSLNADGSGWLASGSLSWDTNGNITLNVDSGGLIASRITTPNLLYLEGNTGVSILSAGSGSPMQLLSEGALSIESANEMVISSNANNITIGGNTKFTGDISANNLDVDSAEIDTLTGGDGGINVNSYTTFNRTAEFKSNLDCLTTTILAKNISTDPGSTLSITGDMGVNIQSVSGSVRLNASTDITANMNITVSSDERLKDIKSNAAASIEDIANVRIVNYTLKDRENVNLGTIAQDWQNIYPNAVRENEEGYLGLDYASVALAAAVTAAKEIVKLKEEIAALRQENKDFKNKLASALSGVDINDETKIENEV